MLQYRYGYLSEFCLARDKENIGNLNEGERGCERYRRSLEWDAGWQSHVRRWKGRDVASPDTHPAHLYPHYELIHCRKPSWTWWWSCTVPYQCLVTSGDVRLVTGRWKLTCVWLVSRVELTWRRIGMCHFVAPMVNIEGEFSDLRAQSDPKASWLAKQDQERRGAEVEGEEDWTVKATKWKSRTMGKCVAQVESWGAGLHLKASLNQLGLHLKGSFDPLGLHLKS